MDMNIGEVAKRLGLTPETLRNWEKQGLIPKAKRVGLKGTRQRTEEQVTVINAYRQANYRY